METGKAEPFKLTISCLHASCEYNLEQDMIWKKPNLMKIK